MQRRSLHRGLTSRAATFRELGIRPNRPGDYPSAHRDRDNVRKLPDRIDASSTSSPGPVVWRSSQVQVSEARLGWWVRSCMGRVKSLYNMLSFCKVDRLAKNTTKFPSALRFKTAVLRWNTLNGPLIMCTMYAESEARVASASFSNRYMTTPAETGFGSRHLS
jgi:hypothetical protein